MSKTGFTIAEIVIVIVILGVMGAVAIPRFTAQQESAQFSEGVSAVQTMLGAQQRYYSDHSSFDAGANCPNLDVSLVPKNFTLRCFNADRFTIVRATRQNGPVYSISVDYTASTSASGYSCAGAGCTPNLLRLLP